MGYLRSRGLWADYALHVWDCHVDDARNTLVWQFLKSDAPVFFFIDDDVGWDPESVVKLMEDKADIVVGAYPLKQAEEDYPVRFLPGDIKARADGLVEIEGGATGFMAIKRHVLEALYADGQKFYGRGRSREELPHSIIFERTFEENFRWSGDYAFCRKARRKGFKVFLDPEILLSHEGRKIWTGCIGVHLRAKSGIINPKFLSYLERLRLGNTKADVFNKLFTTWANPFAACPQMLASCYGIAKRDGGPVLEAGSGLTSLVLACLPEVEVHCLEHDILWLRKVQRILDLLGAKNVHLHYCPLKEYSDGSIWYNVPWEKLPVTFNLAVNDGPPRAYGREGFYKLLSPHTSASCWVVDDISDPVQLGLLKKHGEGRNLKVVGTPGTGMRVFGISRRTEPKAGGVTGAQRPLSDEVGSAA